MLQLARSFWSRTHLMRSRPRVIAGLAGARRVRLEGPPEEVITAYEQDV